MINENPWYIERRRYIAIYERSDEECVCVSRLRKSVCLFIILKLLAVENLRPRAKRSYYWPRVNVTFSENLPRFRKPINNLPARGSRVDR